MPALSDLTSGYCPQRIKPRERLCTKSENVDASSYIRTGSGSDRVSAAKEFIGGIAFSYEARPCRYRSRF